MSVADRITECIKKYRANDLDNALIQLCIALDGTAKNEYPKIKKPGERFRAFIRTNQDIITFVAFNAKFIDCKFGNYSFEQLIYKVLRCGLIHEAKVSAIKFVETGESFFVGDKQWRFPKTFILGALLAVVGAPSNSRQSIAEQFVVEIRGRKFKLNDLCGRADLIRKAMEMPIATA